jgi:hypothetical protein
MNSKGPVLIILLVVALVGLATYLPLQNGPPSGGNTTTGAIPTTYTSTSTVLSTSILNGYFAASSSSLVRVDSVSATVFGLQNETRTIQFAVEFTNVGLSPIYVVSGCGSPLHSAIVSSGGVVQTVKGVRCFCGEFVFPVNASQSQKAVDPGCWSGYYYQVAVPGNFTAKLVLFWSDSQSLNPYANNVTISATFKVPAILAPIGV